MEKPIFDIFSGEPEKNALWIEAVETLGKARERIEQLAAEKPGKYFLFSVTSSTVPLRIDRSNSQAVAVEIVAEAKIQKMTNLEYPSWQNPYKRALLELTPERFQQRLETAETAIFHRLQELAGRNNHKGERLALNDAIRTLRSLQVEKLQFPELWGQNPSDF